MLKLPYSCSIRVVTSKRAGAGKSLKVKRIMQSIDMKSEEIKICLHRKNVYLPAVLDTFLPFADDPEKEIRRVFHVDLAPDVSVINF